MVCGKEYRGGLGGWKDGLREEVKAVSWLWVHGSR